MYKRTHTDVAYLRSARLIERAVLKDNIGFDLSANDQLQSCRPATGVVVDVGYNDDIDRVGRGRTTAWADTHKVGLRGDLYLPVAAGIKLVAQVASTCLKAERAIDQGIVMWPAIIATYAA